MSCMDIHPQRCNVLKEMDSVLTSVWRAERYSSTSSQLPLSRCLLGLWNEILPTAGSNHNYKFARDHTQSNLVLVLHQNQHSSWNQVWNSLYVCDWMWEFRRKVLEMFCLRCSTAMVSDGTWRWTQDALQENFSIFYSSGRDGITGTKQRHCIPRQAQNHNPQRSFFFFFFFQFMPLDHLDQFWFRNYVRAYLLSLFHDR